MPMGTSISLGSIMGLASGFALKKAGAVAAVVFGGIYAFEQGLAYMNYITINWPAVEKDLTALLDVNKDGKVDEKDLQSGYLLALKVLQGNSLAASGGFGAGFLLGVKKG